MTKYADDIVTFLPIKANSDCNKELGREIEHVTNWCDKNGLQLNEKKTKVMFIVKQSYIDKPLTIFPVENEVNILGVIYMYEPNLKWKFEISKRCMQEGITNGCTFFVNYTVS